ncbi:MAG: ComF family protein, partial [Usitatibacteraceae bacterium]
LCGVHSVESICADCYRDLPFRTAPGCPRCCAPVAHGQICGACLADPPNFDTSTSAFTYAYPLDRLVQAYKFNATLSLLPLFAEALTRAVRAGTPADTPRVDLVVPLPLAPKRLAERGFNQSSLLAERVSHSLGARFEARGMLRIRETPPQAGLSRKERLKNVRGAFDCSKRLDGMRIAVVDDVMTTGATLSEAAKALKKAGAAHVSAWVIARATHDSDTVQADRATVPFDDPKD